MSSYNELIKNFERIRTYMREFYIYGFKNRNEYNRKSSRSYDNERRRIESWLGDYMSIIRTSEGKNMFISIDSRISTHNPLYKAWKAKSFTDGDITLHFILFDILDTPDIALSLAEIMKKIDNEYLCDFSTPMMLDESTVRKKLKEYIAEGIVVGEKCGRSMIYHRAECPDVPANTDVLHFYSEVAPCGVIGSYLLDKHRDYEDHLKFKHHYITGALDSGILSTLFTAIRDKCEITVVNLSQRASESKTLCIIPLRIFISVQSGRQHLLAYQEHDKRIRAYRIDYLSDIKIGEVCPRFDELRAKLDHSQQYMWGVSCRKNENYLEHVEFTVLVNPNEEHIIGRLHREKRIGTVERVDESHYRFSADVYDTNEMIPWIRTFICRITELNFTNKTVENQFRNDIENMYKMYGMDERGES